LGNLRMGGLLVLPVSLFDGVDGTLARYTGKTSKFGAFLDSTLDRYEEGALFCGLLWHFATIGSRQGAILAAVALFGSLAVSYTRARAEGLDVECKVGLFTRVERIVALSIGLMLGLPIPTLWLLAIMTHFTALQRIWHVRRATTDGLR
jgi:CDP-diacylglycerol--glycerol-3-phosphate 3-phosphatidyltransferase